MSRLILVSTCLLGLFTTNGFAALSELDSANFENKLEMDALPSTGVWSFGSDTGNAESSIFSITEGRLYQNSYWGTGYYSKPINVTAGQGMSLEWSIIPQQIGWTFDHGYYGFTMLVSIAGTKGAILGIYEDRVVIEWLDAYPHVTYSYDSIKNKKAVFRLAINGSNNWYLYKDGQLLGQFTPEGADAYESKILFGVINNDADSENVICDYIRYTETGPFAPVSGVNDEKGSDLFESRFEMDAMPSTQGWTYGSENGNVEDYVFSIVDSNLVQSTGWGTCYYLKNSFAPNTANGFTIEWSINVSNIGWTSNHGLEGLCMYLGLAGGKRAYWSTYQDRMVFEWEGTYPHTLLYIDESNPNALVGKPTVFRMTVKNNEYNIYMDGKLFATLLGSGSNVTGNSLLFGTIYNDADAESATWNYIRYTDQGAFKPESNPPQNCADVIARGFRLAGDMNGDCVVNLKDLAVMLESWLACNDPAKVQDPASGCVKTW